MAQFKYDLTRMMRASFVFHMLDRAANPSTRTISGLNMPNVSTLGDDTKSTLVNNYISAIINNLIDPMLALGQSRYIEGYYRLELPLVEE